MKKNGASDTLIDDIAANVNKMTDIVAQSRASVETAQIAEVDKKADELIIYLMATFRTNRTSPIQAMRTAAEALYLKTKPYVNPFFPFHHKGRKAMGNTKPVSSFLKNDAAIFFGFIYAEQFLAFF